MSQIPASRIIGMTRPDRAGHRDRGSGDRHGKAPASNYQPRSRGSTGEQPSILTTVEPRSPRRPEFQSGDRAARVRQLLEALLAA